MPINKIITKVDGVENNTINFNDIVSGLSAGNHTITVETYNGNTLVHSDTKNINISGVSGGSFDPDYQAVLDYATANSIPLPDSSQQNVDNQLLIDYKATGAWDLDDIFLKFKGSADIAFKRICWKRLIQVDVFGGLTWDSTGVLGNGTNGYIDLIYNPVTNAVNFNQNSASFNYVGLNNPQTSGVIVGGYNGSSTVGYNVWTPYRVSGSDVLYSINKLEVTNTRVAKVGLSGLYRTSSTVAVAVGSSEKHFTGSTSEAPSNVKLFLFARNNNGTADLFWNERISFFTVGANKYNLHTAMAGVLE